MEASGINAQTTQSALAQMRQQMESAMQTALSKANSDYGNVLGDISNISKPSELLSKLSQLQSTDPEKFKSVMNDIADSLKKAADAAGGTSAGNVLKNLAAKFTSAAQTGDLSQLQPHRHHHAGKTNPAQLFQQMDSTLLQAISQANQDNGNALGDISGVTNISDLMSKLSQLQSTDPEKFKSMMNSIADNLKKASGQSGDSIEGNLLLNLSGKFSTAAESGDLSQLLPPDQGQANPGTDQAKIAQYSTQNPDSTAQLQKTLLDILKNNGTPDSSSKSGADAGDKTSTLRQMLLDTFTKVWESRQ